MYVRLRVCARMRACARVCTRVRAPVCGGLPLHRVDLPGARTLLVSCVTRGAGGARRGHDLPMPLKLEKID